MNKELKKIIEKTLDETFNASPEKMVERNVEEVYCDICPHCKKRICEHGEYTEDGGVTWRHSDCKGLISRPETPMEQISRDLRPFVLAARQQRQQARKTLGLESVQRGFAPLDVVPEHPNDLPLGGDKKYCQDNQKQQAPFPLNTTGLGETVDKSPKEESQPIAAQDYAKFMGGAVRVVNTTHLPIVVAISEFTSNVGDGISAKAYIIHLQDTGPSK